MRDFDFTYNPEIPKARIWELASGRFVEERASVLLCGPSGGHASAPLEPRLVLREQSGDDDLHYDYRRRPFSG